MPAQTQETEKDMPFPLQGIDLSQGHAYQRPLTCETGVNVRAYEPVTNRAKGGARSGLAKYITAQVPAGTHLIQHLNTVDPSVDSALLDWNLPWPNFAMPGTVSLPPVTWGIPVPAPATGSVATVPDPSAGADAFGNRNPGRDIPVGGTGFAPNRNKPSTNKIRFVQIAEDTAQNPVILGSDTAPGNFLFLVVGTTFLDPDVPDFNITVSDSQGNTWTLINSVTKSGTIIGLGTELGLQIWGADNIGGGPCTVTVTPAADPLTWSTIFVCVLEYSGVKTALPVQATGSGSGGHGEPTAPCGLVTVSIPPQLVVGALLRAWTTASLTSVTGSLVLRTTPATALIIADDTAASANMNPTFGMAPADTTDYWVGLSVSLKHSW